MISAVLGYSRQQYYKQHQHVKAILASGYFDPELKKDMLETGAKDFIQKPYVAESILRRVRELLDGKKN